MEVGNFLDKANDVTLPSWPAFMLNDSIANKYWSDLNRQHKDFQFALIDEKSQKWIAVGNRQSPQSFVCTEHPDITSVQGQTGKHPHDSMHA
jgi:hypothetical protein